MKLCLLLTFVLSFFFSVHTFPEQGKWEFAVKNKSCTYFHVNKALYKDSQFKIKVTCDPSKGSSKSMKVRVGWTIRESPCFEEYVGGDVSMPEILRYYYFCPVTLLSDFNYKKVRFLKNEEVEVSCDHFIDQHIVKNDYAFKVQEIGDPSTPGCNSPIRFSCETYPPPQILNNVFNIDNIDDRNSFDSEKRRKREIPYSLIGPKTPSKIVVPNDGVFLYILFIQSVKENDKFDTTVNIEISGKNGYLSANEWPLLPFYGIMSIVYLFFAIGWLVVSAMQWRDLLRIQFWIGAVIFLGMLEKAVFYSEYQSINNTGQSVKGAVLFAELVSCLKRTIARMLVIIVSLGFGIVKPRLGPMLHRVVCVGLLYFGMSAIEATLRIYKPRNNLSNQTLMADIPLAILDSLICWWIFSSLVQTLRTLRLRRNLVKLQLYRQFTNVLMVTVISSIIFMIWVIHFHKITNCLTGWKNLWFDEAYWHILFSVILLVIMILWRPTNNNQRYAFTPLLDASDDEDEIEQSTMSEIYDGIKTRQNIISNNDSKNEISYDRIAKDNSETKGWSDAEIPSSLVDAALPALVDSDEELLNTKFELSKMD